MDEAIVGASHPPIGGGGTVHSALRPMSESGKNKPRRGAWHWLKRIPKVKLIRQGKLPRGKRSAFVYRADFHPWEDANVLDCNPRVEAKANASRNAERPSIRQGVPVNWAA